MSGRPEYRAYLKSLEPSIPKRTERRWAKRAREGGPNPAPTDNLNPVAVVRNEDALECTSTPMDVEREREESMTPTLSEEELEDDTIGVEREEEDAIDFSDMETETTETSSEINVDLLQPILGEQIKTSKIECLLKILCFSLRHGLTVVAITDLCKLINSILGLDAISTSAHKFNTTFKECFKAKYHFYCLNCESYIGDKETLADKGASVNCPTCSKPCDIRNLKDSGFFVTFPIADQVKLILESTENISSHLRRRFANSENDVLTDIHDGELYRDLVKSGFLADENNISLTINTDGARVFKTGKNTLWPIQLRLNELHPKIRFQQNNVILGGFYFGKSEPNMLLFLAPTIKEIKSLYTTGFTWNKDGRTTESKVVLLNGIFDSKAKPPVQGVKFHNGYYGCGYCYHPGVVYPGSNQAKYSMNEDEGLLDDLSVRYTVTKIQKSDCETEEEVDFPVVDRTDEEIRKDMETMERKLESNSESEPMKGVKGKSVLFALFYFNLVFGFSVDYMHQTLLGVVKHVTGLWFNSSSHGNDFYIGPKLKQVDSRLLSLQPPSSISRRPRTLGQRHDWKANEYRSWLLYYSLPCLADILPARYFNHHALLSTAIQILLKTCITKRELMEASWLLVKYVVQFQALYGVENMFYNVHLLLHLGKCVKYTGPLWCFSAFFFETGNGVLVNMIRGTVGVVPQIVKKFLWWKAIPNIVKEYKISGVALDFCRDILRVRLCTASNRVGETTVLGSQTHRTLTELEMEAFQSCGIACTALSYERMVKNGQVIHVTWYGRKGGKSDDSGVRLRDCGSYGVLERIVKVGDQIYVLVRLFNIDLNAYIANLQEEIRCPIKICLPLVYGQYLKMLPAESISEKIVIMKPTSEHNETVYLAEFPNVYEKD